jgi:branched-subunit amino acid ABC-type transport system permease component
VLALFVFFGRSMVGKALRATAINRVGARLMGIPTGAGRRRELCAGGADRRRSGC